MAAKPDFPVRILSPSESIVPAFKSKNSFLPMGMISTSPFTFVATAILFPNATETKNIESIINLLTFIILLQWI